MLISVFKSNQKLVNVLVVVLTIILWIPSFWFDNSIAIHQNSLFNIVGEIRDMKVLNFLISVILISAQGIYLNYIVNEFKLIKNNTYLVALFFVLLNGMSPTFLVFNPVILANTFVLLALHQLFKLYNEKQPYSLLFNTGVLVAIGTLIFFPVIIIFPFIWIVLLYTGTPKWRDFIISIMGLFVPFIFYVTYYFLIDEFSQILRLMEINNVIFIEKLSFDSGFTNYHFYILVVIGLFSGFKLAQTIQRSVIKIRKLKMIVLILMFLLTLTVLIKGNDYMATYLLIATPFSIFLGNYFNEIKRTWLSEILFLSLIIGLVSSYFS